MKVIVENNELDGIEGLVASIGFFDGVHRGHHCLIDQIKQEAIRLSKPSAIITFPTHPRKILHADYQPALLCSYQEKIERLASTGIDYCCSVNFTKEMSQMSAHRFMKEILKEKLNVGTLLIGYDHRFGHNRSDGFEEYKEFGKEIGIDVILAKELDTQEQGGVSSSVIRRLLAEGDVVSANKLLSYNYTISGRIVEGFKVGRTIGFPTANIEVWERYKVIPALGIYAVYVHVDSKLHTGMLYIGNRPTLYKDEDISVEVNIFDFDGDLYDKELTVEFLQFVRHDEKFINIDLLKESISRDKKTVKEILKGYVKPHLNRFF